MLCLLIRIRNLLIYLEITNNKYQAPETKVLTNNKFFFLFLNIVNSLFLTLCVCVCVMRVLDQKKNSFSSQTHKIQKSTKIVDFFYLYLAKFFFFIHFCVSVRVFNVNI